MATIKGWFTMNGVHIPIMEGQSKADAASKYINSKHGKTVAKLSSKTTTKKKENKYTDSYESIEKAADDYVKDDTKGLQERAYNFYDKLGYTDKPNVINKEELERISKTSEFGLLERGYRGENTQSYIEQFKRGDLYIGEQRSFGLGTYFGYGKEAHEIARGYGEHKESNILKACITGNTKIITTEQLDKRRDEFMTKAFKKATDISKTKGAEEAKQYYTKMNKVIMHDDGIFAASLGYDAINVTDAKYIVVLNRGKVLVSE